MNGCSSDIEATIQVEVDGKKKFFSSVAAARKYTERRAARIFSMTGIEPYIVITFLSSVAERLA